MVDIIKRLADCDVQCRHCHVWFSVTWPLLYPLCEDPKYCPFCGAEFHSEE